MDHQIPNQGHGVQGQTWSSLPEVVPSSGLEVNRPYEEFQQKEGYTYEETPVNTQPRSLWTRHKRWIIIGGIAAAVIIAVVVGTTVGLLVRKNGSSSKDGSSPTPESNPSPSPSASAVHLFGTPTSFGPEATKTPSACRGTVCPTTLAVAQFKSDSSFFIFGLGGDGAIWTRQASATQWMGDWESLGGSFASQPGAVSTDDGNVDVFAVDPDGAMHTLAFREGKWADDWVSLGGKATSPPAVCSYASGRIDVFTVAVDGHNLLNKWYEGGQWSPNEGGDWGETDGFISGSPAVSCVGDERIDVTVYGGFTEPYDVVFKHHNSSGWSNWESQGGGYRGDPGALPLSADETVFCGLGSNKDMFTITYSNTDGYGPRIYLGGSLASTPVIFATGTNRIDVLAVGGDDSLWHKARRGSTWATDWESLGGYFNGAPAVVVQGNSIIVFGVGPKGEVIHGNWTATTNYAWGEGSWFADGGEMSTNWLRGGPA